jgi:hypothetical protein
MIDENLLAQLLKAPSPAAQQKLSQIFRWLDQIDSRVNEIESRLSELANHAADQDEKLSMMCSVLKEIDDPYGFGRTLDERILGDAENGSNDEPDD